MRTPEQAALSLAEDWERSAALRLEPALSGDADPKAVPELRNMARILAESAAELRAAAGLPAATLSPRLLEHLPLALSSETPFALEALPREWAKRSALSLRQAALAKDRFSRSVFENSAMVFLQISEGASAALGIPMEPPFSDIASRALRIGFSESARAGAPSLAR